MVGSDKISFLKDTHGVSVMFATLLLILITIIAASGVAFMVSTMQKEAMNRESHQAAVENEELKIVSIEPVPAGDGNLQSIDITVLNLNIADSRISSIRLNDGYFLHFKAYDSSGAFDMHKDYPAVYSAGNRMVIPATKSKTIHLNFSDIVVEKSETISTAGWANNSTDFNYNLKMHPWKAYNGVDFDFYMNDTTNMTRCIQSGNFSINNERQEITFFGNNSGGNLTNNTDYEIFYAIDFISYAGSAPLENEPLRIELITSYINVFKELFTPPMPVAEVQFKVEYLQSANGSQSPNSYLILDASDSRDSDGFITSYKWAVWKDSGNVTLYDYNLSGMVVRPIGIDSYNDQDVTIDLMLTDDDGMVSRLSQVSGNLSIL
ncbi:hypothetical protein V7O62_03135 [Methanolobus sp. ZRKC2]|uniref:hypothetical protein n=1 Tax=Methanolobus sp. ZRKC2 TaxID=3125783 RepID=UPI00324DA70B